MATGKKHFAGLTRYFIREAVRWPNFRRFFQPGYRRNAFLLMSLLIAVLTFGSVILFLVFENRYTKTELQHRADTLTQLLSSTLQTALYIRDKDAIEREIAAILPANDISRIDVRLANGEIFYEHTISSPATTIASTRQVSINPALNPEEAIAGATDLLPEVLGLVTVHLDPTQRVSVYNRHAIRVLLLGAAVWLTGSLFGYLLMQRVTSSYQRISDGLAAIARGEIQTITDAFPDQEMADLASSINNLSMSLHFREQENAALQKRVLRSLEKRAAKAEETMQMKLAEANRMASIGTMASYMAHEVNNPIGLILVNLDLMQDVFTDSAMIYEEHYQRHGNFQLGGVEYKEFNNDFMYILNEMREGAKRVRHIVGDLKRFARQESAEKAELVDLNKILITVLRLCGRKIKVSTSNLDIRLSHVLPNVQGNAQRLEQVVVNLVINACQALPDKSRGIFLSSEYAKDRKQAVIRIRDEGVGVEKEKIPYLTDPFFSTKQNEGGTGLGLAICAQIIAEHHGTLEFASEIGKGMEVTIRLPEAKESI